MGFGDDFGPLFGVEQRVEPLVVDLVTLAGDHPNRAGFVASIELGFGNALRFEPAFERRKRLTLAGVERLDQLRQLLVSPQRRLRILVGDRLDRRIDRSIGRRRLN